MTDEPGGYRLIMPYIVCKSQGGPYDDESFVAGVRMQQINDILERDASTPGKSVFSTYQSPGLLPQLDLVAMQHGYVMESIPWDEHPDDWALVTFKRVGGDD